MNETAIGRGGEIRTRDPHNPIVVRYQAALRPDSGFKRAILAGRRARGGNSAAQQLQHFLEFDAHLAYHLGRQVHFLSGLLPLEALPRAGDGEAVLVEQ